ncbi:alpha/beta-hydrolase [Plenodomus tracheiphilus IPT5]|uniref:Alpha/beta-hydrolase n=1 Tax=Plenodomus tracheiphilus IPT5 TaxID=1408161 RepID=A0A6A7AUD9_9PLEO|nr:alpha/beta-hydrolase [Plenodomus tracheiphilus IPT5]
MGASVAAAFPAPATPGLAQVVPTKYVDVNGVKIAYRRFGSKKGNPVVFLPQFRGTMDVADPLLFNYIAQFRPVVLFDNAGVGHSTGEVGDSVAAQGDVAVSFLKAIGVKKANFLGFSMGGGVAQHIAINYPSVIEKAVIAGSIVGNGPGIELATDAAYDIASKPNASFEEILSLFFYPSNTSTAAGIAWGGRISERNVTGETKTSFVQEPGTSRHRKAIVDFTRNSTYLEQARKIRSPFLITSGTIDVLAPSTGDFYLQQKIPGAHLHIFPDSGHGHLFQFAKEFAELVQDHLNAK